MEAKIPTLINIEFFYAKDCPYCPHVLETLQDLIKTELGPHIIIELIDVESPAGKERAKRYDIKAVPSIAIEGTLKFMGVPHPTLISDEIRKLISNYESIKPLKQEPMEPPSFPEKQNNESSLYT